MDMKGRPGAYLVAMNRREGGLEVRPRLCPFWDLHMDLGVGVTLGFSFLFCQVGRNPKINLV